MAELRPCYADADWATRIEYINENENYYYSDGIELVDFAPGYAHMIMPLQRRHMNYRGEAHGGWVVTLLQQAAGKAALSYGNFVVPEQLSVNYHDTCAGGVLHAVAREKNRGRHLDIFGVDVQDENGRLIASGTVTFYILADKVNFPREKRQREDDI